MGDVDLAPDDAPEGDPAATPVLGALCKAGLCINTTSFPVPKRKSRVHIQSYQRGHEESLCLQFGLHPNPFQLQGQI